MRILIISQYFWPENFRINELSEELNNLENCNITVLTGLQIMGQAQYMMNTEKIKKFFKL